MTQAETREHIHATRLSLYNQGLNDREIGEALHLSCKTINQWRHKNGIPCHVRVKDDTPEEKDHKRKRQRLYARKKRVEKARVKAEQDKKVLERLQRIEDARRPWSEECQVWYEVDDFIPVWLGGFDYVRGMGKWIGCKAI